MNIKTKAILLSIITTIIFPVIIFFIIGIFSSNVGYGFVSLLLLALPGYVYKKALAMASKSQSRAIELYIKYVAPIFFVIEIGICLIALPYIISLIN